jgi:hypothetical protein
VEEIFFAKGNKKVMSHNFAGANLTKFSGVGGGNKSGVNLLALAILPLIFIFPCIKAIYGFSFPMQTASKSSSVIVNVASGFAGLPFLVWPCPLLRSIS